MTFSIKLIIINNITGITNKIYGTKLLKMTINTTKKKRIEREGIDNIIKRVDNIINNKS